MSTGMFQQAFHGGGKYRLRSVFSAVQPVLHWIIVEAAVHSRLLPLNKGAIIFSEHNRTVIMKK
jgi:hypothetical protein